MADYIWSGPEHVRCDIEVEPVGDRRTAKRFTAAARRIYRDGLVPLTLRNGFLAAWEESTAADALARAKLFLDRRFGFGTVAEGGGATEGMKVFPAERVPAEMVIAGYRRYGCRICRIGEPNEDAFKHWIDHAAREHGYEVVSDQLERAPRLRDQEKLFRVVRLVRPASADAPGAAVNAAEPKLPRLMPRKLRP